MPPAFTALVKGPSIQTVFEPSSRLAADEVAGCQVSWQGDGHKRQIVAVAACVGLSAVGAHLGERPPQLVTDMYSTNRVFPQPVGPLKSTGIFAL